MTFADAINDQVPAYSIDGWIEYFGGMPVDGAIDFVKTLPNGEQIASLPHAKQKLFQWSCLTLLQRRLLITSRSRLDAWIRSLRKRDARLILFARRWRRQRQVSHAQFAVGRAKKNEQPAAKRLSGRCGKAIKAV